MFVLLLVEGTFGIEMIHATVSVLPACTLTLQLLVVVIMASHVGSQIPRPSTNLLGDKQHCGVDRGVFEELMHLVYEEASSRGLRLASPRRKHHVPLHVASCFVMLAMADLPAEVRHQES